MGKIYGDEDELKYEGSGGPSHSKNPTDGGPGGGLIQLNLEDYLLLNGNITAKGGNANPKSDSGGGSGGSIHAVVSRLSGNGTFSVSGGDGASRNSGGGAGGRISIRFWRAEQMSMYPNMTKFWSGQTLRDGGRGMGVGGDGSEGTLFSTKCQRGYSGPF